MAFVEIDNFTTQKATDAHSGVTASLTQWRKSRALLRMTFKPAVLESVGWGMNECVTVLIGTEESHGLIRLQKDVEGKFTLKSRLAMKGHPYAQLNLGHRPEFADIVAKAVSVNWEKIDETTVEIALPKWADVTRPKTKAVIAGLPAPMRAASREAARVMEEQRQAETRRTDREVREEAEEVAEFQRRLEAQPKGQFTASLRLTRSEAALLTILTDRAGRVVSKDSIYMLLYSDKLDAAPEEKIIDILICKIRKKLEGQPVNVATFWGQGYSFEGDAAVLMGGA